VTICDPELTRSLPPHLTANTGIDALSHAIEGYLSAKCQGFLGDIAISTCRLIAEALPQTLKYPSDQQAREQMMLAALQGGIVLAQCGTVMVHALGYRLTHDYGLPHGLANALLLDAFVRHMARRGCCRAQDVLGLFQDDLQGFIRRCGIDTSQVAGRISPAQRQEWIEAGYRSYGRGNSLIPLDRDDIGCIIDGLNNE